MCCAVMSLAAINAYFFQMPGYQLSHLEHADVLLAVEDRFQAVVGVNLRFLLAVLQVSLADVGPELLGQLGPGQGLVADNFGEHVVWLYWLHEGCAGLPLGFCGFSGGDLVDLVFFAMPLSAPAFTAMQTKFVTKATSTWVTVDRQWCQCVDGD